MTLTGPLFSPRLTKIFLELLSKDDFISVSHLSKTLNISKRTLFREISGCNYLLTPYHLVLESKPGIGIRVKGSIQEKAYFLKVLQEYHSKSDYYDIQQRRMLLTAEILKNKNLSKLITFARSFDVSEATISNDLASLDGWFESHGLKLVRKPGYGLVLEGNEDDVRRAMTDFVHNQLKENKLIDLIYLYQDEFDIEEYFLQQDSSSILNLLNHQILANVIKVIRNSEFKYVQKMADSSLIGLIIHLTIAIERLIDNEIIQMDPDLLYQLQQDEDFSNAEDLSRSMEKEFDITFPQAEIAYILMHLKGAKLRDLYPESDVVQTMDDIKLKQLIHDMIEDFEQTMGVAMIGDDVLHKGLLTHFRPALTRMNYNLKIRNPLLEQIKQQYPEIFQASQKAIQVMESSLQREIPVDEVGYVALHFGAAFERLKQRMNESIQLKVGVVCASGIGISSLLSSRIKNIFHDLQMVVPLAIEDVDDSLQDQFDLLVTTIYLEKAPICSVYVQPLLTESDIENIKEAIHRCKRQKQEVMQRPPINLKEDPLETLAQINLSIQKLLKQVTVTTIHHALTWNQLIDKVSHMSAQSVNQAKEIKNALFDREKHGSVIVEEVGVILLHAKVKDIKDPILKFFLSDEATFVNEQTQHCSVAMIMVADKECPKDTNKMLSAISAGLVDDDLFRNAIKNKNKENIESSLSLLLQKWYRNETMQRLKNI